jgi:hypothetical protein
MAEYTTLVPQSLSTKGNVNQAYSIPAGDEIEVLTGFMDGRVPYEIWVILNSTLTGAAAFNSNAGYAAAPNGTQGRDLAGTFVRKSGTRGLTNGTFA